MRRAGNVLETGGNAPWIAAERHDSDRLTKRHKRANQLGRIAPDARGGRTEGAAVETYAECVMGIQNAKCKMQTESVCHVSVCILTFAFCIT
jgi:hypothetical protein